MNENLVANMKSSLQPMMAVAEINSQTFKRFTTLQSNCMTDCFNAGLEQKPSKSTQDNNCASVVSSDEYHYVLGYN